MLQILGVTKRFRRTLAVDHLTLQVGPGTIFGLLGPNGAGKTTTIRMIMNFFRPDEGQIRWRNLPVENLSPGEIGYLPEERGLYQHTTLRETLIYFAKLKGLSTREAGRRIGHWLERFNLGTMDRRRIEDLSKGNQQKIQFIVAMLSEPRLLILDEPFAGLDPVNQIQIKTCLRAVQQSGSTVILSTHQMDLVEELCDEIALINRGQCILAGPMATIFSDNGDKSVQIQYDGPDLQPADLSFKFTATGLKKIDVALTTSLQLNRIVTEVASRVVLLEVKLHQKKLADIFIESVRRNQGESCVGC